MAEHSPAKQITNAVDRLHAQGNALIAKAIDIDEAAGSSRKELAEAVGAYQQGRQKLSEALGKLSCPKETKVKLQETIRRIDERVLLLQKKLETAAKRPALRPPIPISAVKGVEPALVKRIMDEVVDTDQCVDTDFDSICGQEQAKNMLQESIFLPLHRPDLFTGIRSGSKGILLFGPPGTGKTMLVRAVISAASRNSIPITFFNLSAASLVSKYVGESEKLVRALFSVARQMQPAVIFIDEIDSILLARADTGNNEQESMRRVKTEFLLQFDGLASDKDERVIVIGATNRPHDLDDAARRRFTKRILVTLPTRDDRRNIFAQLLSSVSHSLVGKDFERLAVSTEGFSAADCATLAREIAMGPIRDLNVAALLDKSKQPPRPVQWKDAEAALRSTNSSVNAKAVSDCVKWNQLYGS